MLVFFLWSFLLLDFFVCFSFSQRGATPSFGTCLETQSVFTLLQGETKLHKRVKYIEICMVILVEQKSVSNLFQ